MAFVARQVRVSAGELAFYDWSGRTIKRHRAEIRGLLGFRPCGVEDADKAGVHRRNSPPGPTGSWLVEVVAHGEDIAYPTATTVDHWRPSSPRPTPPRPPSPCPGRRYGSPGSG